MICGSCEWWDFYGGLLMVLWSATLAGIMAGAVAHWMSVRRRRRRIAELDGLLMQAARNDATARNLSQKIEKHERKQ